MASKRFLFLNEWRRQRMREIFSWGAQYVEAPPPFHVEDSVKGASRGILLKRGGALFCSRHAFFSIWMIPNSDVIMKLIKARPQRATVITACIQNDEDAIWQTAVRIRKLY